MKRKPIDLLGESTPATTTASSAQEAAQLNVKGSYSHIDGSTCPVCRNQMQDVKLRGGEVVKFCPDHRISFPQAGA